MKNTLKTIASRLNERKILWALGGSWLLQLQGQPIIPHDIDLLVAIQDAMAAEEVLQSLGTLQTPKPLDPRYLTGYFREYRINGVDVDLIGDFKIVDQGITFSYPFDEQSVVKDFWIEGIKIPCTSLEDWFILYRLMGRNEKASLLATLLRRDGILYPELLRRTLLQVPQPTQNELRLELNFETCVLK
jgi:hypothetical protein